MSCTDCRGLPCSICGDPSAYRKVKHCTRCHSTYGKANRKLHSIERKVVTDKGKELSIGMVDSPVQDPMEAILNSLVGIQEAALSMQQGITELFNHANSQARKINELERRITRLENK